MIFNRMNSLNNSTVLKNSDKSGGDPLACYSINASKTWRCIILVQDYALQRHKIIRRYKGFAFINVHTNVPLLLFKISNKKQSP